MTRSAAPSPVRVRAPHAGEGAVVSALWRELWIAHEDFGGYETSKEPGAFDEVARRVDDESRVRAGEPLLGRHVHLVAEIDGRIVGQVEGWVERHHRAAPRLPSTCEVRSLIVTPEARNRRVGRALLEGLCEVARRVCKTDVLVAAAEVLSKNPARTFYDRESFRPASWAVRVAARDASSIAERGGLSARPARVDDALALCVLDTQFHESRRDHGDPRYGPARSIDATWLGNVSDTIRAASQGSTGPVHFVVSDAFGNVRGKAVMGVSPLLSPFARAKRAIVGFVAFDPSVDARGVASALLAATGRLALLRGARWVEIVDITRPATALHEAFIAVGAAPWSTTVLRAIA